MTILIPKMMGRLSPLRREIKYINKIPYILKAVYPIDRIKDASGLKQWLDCTHAFKVAKHGVYYFCNEIEEAEIIVDTPLLSD